MQFIGIHVCNNVHAAIWSETLCVLGVGDDDDCTDLGDGIWPLGEYVIELWVGECVSVWGADFENNRVCVMRVIVCLWVTL